MILSKIENFALKISEPVVKAQGYEIYDVEYVKEGPHWFLRIYIERDGGVDIDDCEAISRAVSKKLDADDFIKNNYFLEVSSPGIERILRHNSHFESAIGKRVNIKLKNKKNETGILSSHANETITLDDDITINKKDIEKANIVFDFSDNERN